MIKQIIAKIKIISNGLWDLFLDVLKFNIEGLLLPFQTSYSAIDNILKKITAKIKKWNWNRIRKRFKETEEVIVLSDECQYIEITESEGFKIKKCELELDFVCRTKCFDVKECETCESYQEQLLFDRKLLDDFEIETIDIDTKKYVDIYELKNEKSELTKNSQN